MKSKNRILRVLASLLLLTTLLVSVFAPAVSATNEQSPFINQVSKDVNTDFSQFYNPAVLYALPEGVDDEEEISLIIRSKEDTLLDAYDKSSFPYSFTEYCKSDEAKSIIAAIDKNNARLIDMLDTADVNYTVGEEYNTLLAGFEIVVQAKYFEEVCNTLGRDATVIVGEVYEAADAKVVENEVDVYDTGIFNSSSSRFDGSGMVVAVLDTGCDYTHSVFSVNNFTSQNLGMTFEELSTLVGSTTASTFHESMTTEDVYVNVKIPYAYDYADKDTDVMPLSSDHGTHVAGIIAGKDADDKTGDRITGVAPNAQLAIMKVFSDLSSGAKTSWMLAALEDCVVLGVDVINMSLGASYGFSRDLDNARMNELYDAIRERGISLVVAAGNSYNSTHGSEKNGSLGLTSNPDSATVGSPSTYDASLSVASIEGVVTYYLLFGDRIIYYTESADRISEDKNFVEDLIGDSLQPVSYEFVLIPGVGREADYTGIDVTGKIALVQRGNTTFEEKANTAEDMGAAGVIIYNNVSGEIKMTVGDTKIAVCSISQDDGEALAAAKTGKITVSRTQAAGPFMSSFSSWGTGPDLSIKPEITAHGGSILSAVPGQGYERLSGTSMAAPNTAGVTTLLRQYVIERFFANEKDNFGNLSAENQMKVTAMVNRLMMSTADIVINKNGLPYSVRKQGAGLLNLANSTTTGAYILTYDRHDGSVLDKSKIELGDDPDKTGVYTLKFAIDNFGNTTVSYNLSSYVMTEGVSETLTTDGKTTVTEEGYILDGAKVELVSITGGTANGKSITVAGGSTAEITVKITLSDADKKYLDDSFENGMYVEGYLMLDATGETTVDLSVPYLAFYGDWTEAPIFDIDYFETNKDELDDSIDLLDKTLPDAYATRVLGGLYDDYISYLGAYYYIQKPGTNMIAADRKYIAISNQEKAVNSIRSVWAGLLRNCAKVEIIITDDATGEVVHTRTEEGIRKSPSNGSTIYGSTIDIEFSAAEHNLKNNTAYTVTLQGFLDYGDGGVDTNDKNTFTFPFVTDFEAPTVTDCEFYTEYDKSTKTNRLYAKIAVYDNHYSMAMIPGYLYLDEDDKYNLANFDQYPNQIYSSFNSTSYVVYELTDYIDDIKNGSYNKNSFTVALLDYAMNESLYEIALPNKYVDLYFAEESVTLSPNQTYKLSPIVYPETEWTELIDYTTSDPSVVRVVNNELVAVGSGSATVEAKIHLGGSINNVKTATIDVTVLAEGDPGYRRYDKPVVSHFALTGYDTIKAYYMQASEDRDIGLEGSQQVFYTSSYSLSLFPSETVKLTYELVDYFDNTEVVFKSSNSNIVTVDEEGTIKAVAEGFASVSVRIKADGKDTFYTKTVNITVKDPYETMGPWLMHYYGLGGKVVIPEDLFMTEIGEYAFSNCEYIPKDLNAGDVIDEEDPLKTKPSPIGDDTITEIVIPEGIKKIGAFAFANLTALEKVTLPSTLVTIDQGAFAGCTSLTLVEGLENVKFINAKAFQNCDLTGAYDFSNATAISDRAFEGNEHLTAITLPESAQSIGAYTFAGCKRLATVTIEAEKIKLGAYAFSNCTSLTEFSLNASVIPAGTFSGCTSLSKMTIGKDVAQIGEYAFRNTRIASFTLAQENTAYVSHDGGKYFTDATGTKIVLVAPALSSLTVTNDSITTVAMGAVAGNAKLFSVNIPSVTRIEKYAFADCTLLVSVTLGALTEIGDHAFYNTALYAHPSLTGVSRIGDYAFSRTNLSEVTIPDGITVGKYAFADCSELTRVTIGDGVTIGDYAFSFDKEAIFDDTRNLTYYQKNGKVYYYLVFNTPITSLTIGDGAKIGEGAFANNGNLETVTLGEGAKIGSRAFYNCMALKNIDLSKVISIGEYSFAGDTLYEFFIEKIVDETDGVEKNTLVPAYEIVGNNIFYVSRSYGAALTAADLSSLTSLGKGAFVYCKNLTTVTLGEGVTVIPESAFGECMALVTIDLSGITEIGRYAFAATAIASADLSSAIELGDYAFTHCKNLTEITLGENISEIGREAFYNCTALATASGLNKVKRINDYAFANTALVRADLSGAEYIGEHAFMKQEPTPFIIELGDALTDLGDNPFANCIISKLSKKEDVYFNDNKVETKTVYTYDISDSIKVIDGSLYRVVPKGLELITYCGDGTAFAVADTTVRISAMAFAGTGLKSVTLPYTVRSIGHKALYGCDELTVVTFTSYNAPILEEQYDQSYFSNPKNWPGKAPGTTYGMGLIKYPMWGVSQYPSNTFYGANFVDYVGKLENRIVMVRPSNGLNYNTFILDTYFATVIDGKPAADATTLLAIEAIRLLPETVSLSDEALVIAARAAYDKVANTEQRALVTEYAKLTKAEKRIADLKYLQNENQPTPEEPTPEPPVVPDEKMPVGTIILIVSLSVVGAALIALGVIFGPKLYKKLVAKLAKENSSEENGEEETENEEK